MTHEEDIYDVCIARSLIIIGWIHVSTIPDFNDQL